MGNAGWNAANMMKYMKKSEHAFPAPEELQKEYAAVYNPASRGFTGVRLFPRSFYTAVDGITLAGASLFRIVLC
jgi:hypothetical protein